MERWEEGAGGRAAGSCWSMQCACPLALGPAARAHTASACHPSLLSKPAGRGGGETCSPAPSSLSLPSPFSLSLLFPQALLLLPLKNQPTAKFEFK